MQNTILCYLNLPYSRIEHLVRISDEMKIETFIEMINKLYPSIIQPIYLYDLTRKMILDSQLTFQQTKTKSGAYLYLM